MIPIRLTEVPVKRKCLLLLPEKPLIICLRSSVTGIITQSRVGRELFKAGCFVDSTAYGDLSYYAGAEYVELNDHPVCNSMGLGNVNIEKLYAYLVKNNALGDLAYGLRDGKEGQIIRFGSESGYTIRGKLPDEFVDGVVKLGSGLITTTVHDNYLMFIKVNYKMPVSPTNRDEVSKAELPALSVAVALIAPCAVWRG
jgi:hypothetical protein